MEGDRSKKKAGETHQVIILATFIRVQGGDNNRRRQRNNKNSNKSNKLNTRKSNTRKRNAYYSKRANSKLL